MMNCEDDQQKNDEDAMKETKYAMDEVVEMKMLR